MNKLDLLRADYEAEVKRRGLYKAPRDKWLHLNGKLWGKVYKHSGFRSLNCPEGAEFSRHKKAIAWDFKCRHLNVLLYLFRKNWRKYSIKRMESPKKTFHRGWLHVEIDKPLGKRLYVFNP